MELFLLYIWMKLGTFTAALVLTSIGLFVAGFHYLKVVPRYDYDSVFNRKKVDYDDYKSDFLKENVPKFWKCVYISATMMTLALVLPSQNQVAVLVGTHYALELGKSPEGQKIVSVVRMKANKYLDEQLKELIEESTKEKK